MVYPSGKPRPGVPMKPSLLANRSTAYRNRCGSPPTAARTLDHAASTAVSTRSNSLAFRFGITKTRQKEHDHHGDHDVATSCYIQRSRPFIQIFMQIYTEFSSVLLAHLGLELCINLHKNLNEGTRTLVIIHSVETR